MSFRIIARFIFLALAAMAAAGCAITGSTSVEREHFGPKKRFAVVTVYSTKAFQGEKGLTQAFKDLDDIPGANSQPILNALHPKIITALGRNRHFTLLPVSSVQSSNAYRKVPEDPRTMKVLFLTVDMNVVPGYKFYSDEKKFAQLAKELNVDGVISVAVNFSISSGKSGVSINGLSLGAKSYSAMATASIIAYNREGKVIWKDSTIKEADPGDKKAIILVDISDVTSTDFQKMHPSAIEIGGKAIDILMTRFNDTMAGNQTSRFQAFK